MHAVSLSITRYTCRYFIATASNTPSKSAKGSVRIERIKDNVALAGTPWRTLKVIVIKPGLLRYNPKYPQRGIPIMMHQYRKATIGGTMHLDPTVSNLYDEISIFF